MNIRSIFVEGALDGELEDTPEQDAVEKRTRAPAPEEALEQERTSSPCRASTGSSKTSPSPAAARNRRRSIRASSSFRAPSPSSVAG